MPERVQLRRKKGFRLPENTASVARPTIYGNPFRMEEFGRITAIHMFDEWLAGGDVVPPPGSPERSTVLHAIEDLRGKNLACFCPLDRPCHADVLLKIANREIEETASPGRPLLRYHGGKWRLAPWIISNFPSHRTYVEPFGGAASVLVQKPRARTEIYNDLDSEIYSLFSVLRDPAQTARLADALRLTPFSRDEFDAAYDATTCPIELARRTLVKSFMGMGSKGIFIKSGFDARVTSDGFISRLNAFSALPDVVQQFMHRLRGVVLENTDGIALIKRYADRDDALFYIDPPYVFDTYQAGNIYRHRMSDDQHRELSEVLHSVKGAVVISGYPSALYDELFSDWRRIERGTLADAGKHRTEVLWLRNIPSDLFSE